MAESFSVKAILSATDKGFTSAFEKANAAADGLKEKITSGLGFGILTGIGQKAFDVVSSGIGSITSELSASSAAWKTFEGNMGMLGKTADEINSTKKELQDFATQTVYSASDMATTYSQLAAVGTKNCTQLVKGFGGLAAAAENPTQAMKTLSQQATQMAAKPKVAWEDFKLILEQTPAGIAAIAKEMGKTTTQLVTDVQKGTVKTEDFFDAITKVGTNDAFTQLATEYKTVDQAMDGLTETLGVKLAPAFDAVSEIGIDAIEGIISSMDKFDASKIADSITGMVDKVEPYWTAFKNAASDAGSGIMKIVGVAGEMADAFLSNETVIKMFSDTLESAGNVIKSAGDFVEDNKETIKTATPIVIGFFAAWKGYKKIKSATSALQKFTDKLTGLAGSATEKVTDKLDDVAKSSEKVGKSSSKSATDLVASGKSFALMAGGVLLLAAGFALLAYSAISLADAGPLAIGVMAGLVVALALLGAGITAMLNSIKPGPAQLNAISVAMLAMGAAVVLISAGFMLLANSAISLANAGPLAIGVMAGMVLAIAGLAAGAAVLGPALTAGAVGFLAFGAAIVLVGTGALIAGAALAIVAAVLPTIVEYGVNGAVGIAALGASMLAFGAGALVAAAGSIALGAGLIVAGAGALVAAAGMIALGAAVLVTGAGLILAASGATVLGPAILLIAAGGLTAAASMLALSAGIIAFTAGAVAGTAGLVALSAGLIAGTASMVAFTASLVAVTAGMLALAAGLLGVLASMKSIQKSAKSTASSLKSMKASISFVNSALEGLGSLAKSAIKSLINAFDNAESKVKTAGRNIGTGITDGVKSGTIQLPSIANQAVFTLVATLQAAQPLTYSAGAYIGKGLANGLRSSLGEVKSVAAQLASAAESAIRAKAKIHSPSRVSDKLGTYWGQGLVNGIAGMKAKVAKATESVFSIPQMYSPQLSFAGAFDGKLDNEYSYYQRAEYTVYVPLSVDGKEFAYATAKYTDEELKKQEKLKNMIKGVK
ncbi:MAG: tape measure protein [Thomasclavelia sp.]